ncbi:hypothetical protein QYM36_008563 [Artemia franciscana]|nr:hypothetical protein QYM36_008563 [Artemia franciscana]
MVKILFVLTPVTATVALFSVLTGVMTSAWLYSEEKFPNPKFNNTGDEGDDEYISKYTASGLWILCYLNPGESQQNCIPINYFPKEEYSPDPNDSTMAIPYIVVKVAPFYFTAALLLIVAEVSCITGQFSKRRKILTFIGGVIFIVSGLLLLMGFVMYISGFKAEIGGKLRPKSPLQPAMFTYKFGYSFLFVVCGFLASEIAGTSAVFLFIYWHKHKWAKRERHKRFSMALVQGPIDISNQGIRIPIANFSLSPNHVTSNHTTPRRHSLGSSMRTDNEYHLDSSLPPLPESVRTQRRCIVHPFNTQRHSVAAPPPRSISIDAPIKGVSASSSCPGCRQEARTLPRRFPRDETVSTILTAADVNTEFYSDSRTSDSRTFCASIPKRINSMKLVTPV